MKYPLINPHRPSDEYPLVEPKPLREVSYDGMWKHSCTATMQTIYIGRGEVCNYCGEWEELPKKWDGDRL